MADAKLVRRSLAALFIFAAAIPFSLSATALDDAALYKAVAFVTGTEEPERSRGLRDGLRQVFVKLTGDAALADSPALTPYLAEAARFVASHEYEDRMKGIPVHDEQGTRERPHFLYITFDRAKLDAALAELGLRKWPEPRPRLAVLLAVRDARRSYVLTETGENGYGQREVLKSVSDKRGVPIALPPANMDISVDDIRAGQAGKLQRAAVELSAGCPLAGTLDLDAAGVSWNMRWTLSCQGVTETWSLTGVGFDRALGSGLETSARLLSRGD